jgi:predicted RNase H-like nuclease (RuvC/YqgF family)
MAVKVIIKNVGANYSPEEELEIIDELYAEFQVRGGYLKNFLSRPLILWLRDEIAYHHSADIYDHYTKGKSLIKRLGDDIRRYEETINEFSNKLKEKEKEIGCLKFRFGCTLAGRDEDANLKEAKKIIEDRDMEILKLKASLYDALHRVGTLLPWPPKED